VYGKEKEREKTHKVNTYVVRECLESEPIDRRILPIQTTYY